MVSAGSVVLFLFFLLLASHLLFPPLLYLFLSLSSPASTLTLYLVKRTPTWKKLAVHSLVMKLVPAVSVPWRTLDFCSDFTAVPLILRSLRSITWKNSLPLPSLPFSHHEYYD